MKWNAEEYRKKLRALSDDTIQMISELGTMKDISKIADMIMGNKPEQEIAEELKQLTKIK